MDDESRPELYASIDTDEDGAGVLRVAVTNDGAVYETTTVDLNTLLQTEHYVRAFERPALTLLSVWSRAEQTEPEEPADDAAGGEEEAVRSEAPPAANPTPEDD